MIGSVQKALTILGCFSIHEPELSVTELSQKLGVHKSTVSRLLGTLSVERLVERNPTSGKYRLGIGLIELAGLVVIHADLRQVARPLLRKLSELTQETVNLAILDELQSFNIEQAVSYERHVIGIGWVGRKTPLHATSTGKVLLAFLSQRQDALLQQIPLTRYTERTITDLMRLKQELAEIRGSGYALGLEELEVGLNAVAAPVFDHRGENVAAVSVTAPPSRLSESQIREKTAPQVVACADEISRALGYVALQRPAL